MKLSMNMRRLVVGVAAAVCSTGCATASMMTNPEAKFPLVASEQAPAFLFPINLGHLGSGGDTTLMGATVTGGIASRFGKTVVSGQQLFDLVGNLSYELAEQIQSQANAKSFQMSGSAGAVAKDLSQKMELIIGKLVELKLIDKPLKFKYIIALHSHGESALGGTMLKVESWGGIYDTETQQILSYISSTDTYANKPEAVMAQLPSAYNKIVEQLLAGAAK